MYAFSVSKKIDYSSPILFIPLGSSTIATSPVSKKTAPKTVEKSIKIEPKKATTIAAQPKKVAVKKIENPEKKVISTETPKSVPTEKIETKKDTPPIPIEKKEENKLAKALDVQSSCVKSTADKQNIVPATIENKQLSPTIHVPKNAQVSHDFREVEALKRGTQLQKELVQQWHPPIGVSPDCTCDISFFVNKQGTIENLKMIKSSGVMMFDISARQALFSMKMPQWTYGKPLIISFKQ